MFCLCSYLGLVLHIISATRPFLIVFTLFLYPQNSTASDFLDDVHVFENGGVYHISITAEIAANARHVRHVLTDYRHIYRLNDSIIKSKILNTSDDNRALIETLTLCCIPLFCREVTRVEEVRILKSGDIHTRIVPEKSDFSSGEATWKIKATGDTTRLSYLAKLEPDFFVPSVLGTKMLIQNLREQFSTTFHRIQHIARINEERELNNNFETTKKEHRTDEAPNSTVSNPDVK